MLMRSAYVPLAPGIPPGGILFLPMSKRGNTMSTTTYRVTGMTCAHCVATVRGGIEQLGGVVRADVDLATATVAVETSQPVADEAIAAAVDEAGYAFGGRA
jgi:copper chaperone CopZ